MRHAVLFLFSFVFLFCFNGSIVEADVKFKTSDYEAELFLEDQQTEKRLGKAKWSEYKDENTVFKVTINTQDHEFSGPFVIFLNDTKVGETIRSEILSGEKKYTFHKFKLESEKEETVPFVSEQDQLKLVSDVDGKVIIGSFVPD